MVHVTCNGHRKRKGVDKRVEKLCFLLINRDKLQKPFVIGSSEL